MTTPADPVVTIEVTVPQLAIAVADGDLAVELTGANAASVSIDVD